MSKQEIKYLLEKYYDGECTLHEETQLRDLILEDNSDELKYDRIFMKAMRTHSQEKDEDFKNADCFMAKIEMEENRVAVSRQLSRNTIIGIAASIALLLIGFGGGIIYEKDSIPQAEVTALKDEMSQIKEMQIFSQLSEASASDRIRAVKKIQSSDDQDTRILETLVYSVNADPNANVRLAAVEALAHFNDSTAIDALTSSLSEQQDPLVQIAIIEVLIDQNQKSAIDEIQQLLLKDNLQAEVRLQAEMGISQLL